MSLWPHSHFQWSFCGAAWRIASWYSASENCRTSTACWCNRCSRTCSKLYGFGHCWICCLRCRSWAVCSLSAVASVSWPIANTVPCFARLTCYFFGGDLNNLKHSEVAGWPWCYFHFHRWVVGLCWECWTIAGCLGLKIALARLG